MELRYGTVPRSKIGRGYSVAGRGRGGVCGLLAVDSLQIGLIFERAAAKRLVPGGASGEDAGG
jgi:hypothetical protein